MSGEMMNIYTYIRSEIDANIDEKYTGTITELPNELQNYKIYEQGDFTK